MSRSATIYIQRLLALGAIVVMLGASWTVRTGAPGVASESQTPCGEESEKESGEAETVLLGERRVVRAERRPHGQPSPPRSGGIAALVSASPEAAVDRASPPADLFHLHQRRLL